MEDSTITFMDTQWISVEDNILTIGVNEEGLMDMDQIVAVDLPSENDEVTADEICGELDSRDGPLNIYSPVDGSVLELNAAVIDSPELIKEDPYGEGWLMRIEPHNTEDVDRLFSEDREDDTEEASEEL